MAWTKDTFMLEEQIFVTIPRNIFATWKKSDDNSRQYIK